MRKLVYHIIAFLAAVIFALIFYADSLELPDSANQLPQLVSYIIIILSTGMLINAVIEYRQNLVDHEEEPEKVNVIRVILFVGLIALYIFTIDKVGYFIMTPIFMLASFYYLKSSSNRNIILITLGFIFFVYILFVKMLNLPIPMGFLS